VAVTSRDGAHQWMENKYCRDHPVEAMVNASRYFDMKVSR
jgi:hypothetical protein